MANRNQEIYSTVVDVAWANLRRPDEFRGSKKHDLQVVVNPEFKAQLDEIGMPLTGTYTGKESGDTIVKVKTTEFTKKGEESYGNIVDSQGKKTDYFPGKGDKVRVKIWVREWEGKASLFLSGVQVIEANGSTGSSGWETTEGGYQSEGKEAAPAAPAPADTECSDCPAAGCDDCPKADSTDSADLPF